MTKNLKPCPFCGSIDVGTKRINVPWSWKAICTNCLSEGPSCHTEKEAREAWNRRAEEE